MSNNTSVSGITKPTQYTLLDNNHKYLPREFTFVPTVSSESGNNITETVKNALSNDYSSYYDCTPQDFVCNISVKSNLGDDVVYKTENKEACVYQIGSGETTVYKYCEDTAKVNINALGNANVNIGNVTVKKGEDVLIPLVSETDNITEKEITVPKNYSSLEINSSDVYFRKENNIETYVTINNTGTKDTVSFSTNISPSNNIINFFDNNFEILLNDNKYFFDSMIEEGLVNANNKLNEYNSHQNETLLIGALGNEISALVKTAQDANIYLGNAASTLNSAASTLKKASDLSSAESTLSSAASDLSRAASTLKEASDLSSAASDLNSALYSILMFSIALKESKLFTFDKLWIKEDSVVDEADKNSLNNIKTNLISYVEGVEEEDNFKKLASTYAIYNNNDNNNIGLVDFSTRNYVVVTGFPVLKGIFKYCPQITDKELKDIEMVALDTAKKMIIYETSNDNYDLVYLENHDSPGRKKILPDDDDFNPTTSTTNP